MGDWQPMDTAPKEGSGQFGVSAQFLAVRKGSNRVVIGWWDDDRYSKKPRPYWAGTDHSNGVAYMRNRPFRMWQPLPEVPVEAGP